MEHHVRLAGTVVPAAPRGGPQGSVEGIIARISPILTRGLNPVQ